MVNKKFGEIFNIEWNTPNWLNFFLIHIIKSWMILCSETLVHLHSTPK